jgi:phosphoenolpyruvate carboxykinase (GTP)
MKGISSEQFYELMSVDTDAYKQEISAHEELFTMLYDKLPKEFIFMRELILSSLWRSPKRWELIQDPT